MIRFLIWPILVLYKVYLLGALIWTLPTEMSHFATPEVQQKYFRTRFKSWRFIMLSKCLGIQLSLAKRWQLPLFLHSRAAHSDFVRILREEGFGENGGRGVGAKGGVVHSFTGTVKEAAELVSHFFTELSRSLSDLHIS